MQDEERPRQRMERGRSAKCGRARETNIVIGERMKEKRGRNGDRAREIEKEEERERAPPLRGGGGSGGGDRASSRNLH